MTLWVKHTKAERIALLQRAEEKFHINQLALEGLLGCWRTGHGDHRPTLRARAFYLENWFLITGYNVSRHYFACFWGLKANESNQYLVPITTVLRRRLLQYFVGDYCSTSQEITPVLGRDYCSTWCRLLQYLGQVLAHKGKSYFTN